MWPRRSDPETSRHQMVDQQIAARGVRDPAVLAAMREVPREKFVPEHEVPWAHEDTPLPIGEGQTISQPYIVAWMAEAAQLEPTSRVLEIGTGCGYAAAVLGTIAAEVWTIERISALTDQARERLRELGYDNVHVVQGDGTLGLPDQAPFDAIIVTAGGPRIPDALRDQLAEGGRLVMPVGTFGQILVRVVRCGDDTTEEELGGVRFVPLVGEEGWAPGER